MKDLLAYLYGESQAESVQESVALEIERIMEEAEGEEPLRSKRTPLVKALAGIGVKNMDSKLECDSGDFALCCADEGEYRELTAKLGEAETMEKLAELGWVAVRCGDVAMSNEAPDLRIRFIDITVAGEDAENSEKSSESALNKAIKKGREFATTEPEHDEENPVEFDDKTSSARQKGVGDSKDGPSPEGKPKGSTKAEAQEMVDSVFEVPFDNGPDGPASSRRNAYGHRAESKALVGTLLGEGGHKAGCTCGFCKNKGKLAKKDDSDDDKKPDDSDKPDWQSENLARRRGHPKALPKNKPVASRPKASGKSGKAYKTPARMEAETDFATWFAKNRNSEDFRDRYENTCRAQREMNETVSPFKAWMQTVWQKRSA